jgi:hypothetical protein
VLAAALVREGNRDADRRTQTRREARALVVGLAQRYPGNPVFARFLREVAEPGP